MVLTYVGVLLVLLAILALVPSARVPTWLGLYAGVGIACVILVVAVALIA